MVRAEEEDAVATVLTRGAWAVLPCFVASSIVGRPKRDPTNKTKTAHLQVRTPPPVACPALRCPVPNAVRSSRYPTTKTNDQVDTRRHSPSPPCVASLPNPGGRRAPASRSALPAHCLRHRLTRLLASGDADRKL